MCGPPYVQMSSSDSDEGVCKVCRDNPSRTGIPEHSKYVHFASWSSDYRWDAVLSRRLSSEELQVVVDVFDGGDMTLEGFTRAIPKDVQVLSMRRERSS